MRCGFERERPLGRNAQCRMQNHVMFGLRREGLRGVGRVGLRCTTLTTYFCCPFAFREYLRLSGGLGDRPSKAWPTAFVLPPTTSFCPPTAAEAGEGGVPNFCEAALLRTWCSIHCAPRVRAEEKTARMGKPLELFAILCRARPDSCSQPSLSLSLWSKRWMRFFTERINQYGRGRDGLAAVRFEIKLREMTLSDNLASLSHTAPARLGR